MELCTTVAECTILDRPIDAVMWATVGWRGMAELEAAISTLIFGRKGCWGGNTYDKRHIWASGYI